MAKLSIAPKGWENMDEKNRAWHIYKVSKAISSARRLWAQRCGPLCRPRVIGRRVGFCPG
jgi:hypothetical protein